VTHDFVQSFPDAILMQNTFLVTEHSNKVICALNASNLAACSFSGCGEVNILSLGRARSAQNLLCFAVDERRRGFDEHVKRSKHNERSFDVETARKQKMLKAWDLGLGTCNSSRTTFYRHYKGRKILQFVSTGLHSLCGNTIRL